MFIDMFNMLFHYMNSFRGVSTCHFIVRRFFSVNFWTLVRGHRVQIVVPQGGWQPPSNYRPPRGLAPTVLYYKMADRTPPLKSNPHLSCVGKRNYDELSPTW